MHLSLNILKDIVDLNGLDPQEIGLKLTMSSAEIEGVETTFAHFDTIVTARLLEVKKHPDSDHLTVCQVSDGTAIHNVVCGAPNHKTGDITALALVGTKLSEDFEIKSAKVRGVESNGMLCSARELGLSDNHEGILIFPPDTGIGIKLSDLYKDWVDTRFEIDNKSITHRPDLWGHIGFARELSAIFGRSYKDTVDLSIAAEFKKMDDLSVEIRCPELAPRYCGLVIKNIRIGESPEWLKSRVTSIGMRPINNIVDVTNYVMAEIGEPMHAFDRKKLEGNNIIVRLAAAGETLVTLDGQKHELSDEDIVIADSKNPIALAGVMGGGNSEIDDETTEIVLEAANFNAVSIRKTAHRYNTRTDAAMRFEKSLDPELCMRAIIRCYQIIKQLCPDAYAATEVVDAYPVKFPPVHIKTDCSYIRHQLGKDLTDRQITDILTALDYKIINIDGKLEIDVPSYRATKDIAIPADIVEEVGRIYGYDNIEESAPLVPCAPPEINEKRRLERKIKQILSRDHGMIEVYNYSFTGESLLNRIGCNEDKELRLRNALSVEQDRMRRSLVPMIISNIESNLKHSSDFRIFEAGRVYLKSDRKSAVLVSENYRIAGAVVISDKKRLSFYDAKSAVKDLCSQLKLRGVQFIPAGNNLPVYAHPGRSMQVKIDGKDAGLIFEIHPKIKKEFEIRGNAAIFDIDMDLIHGGSKSDIRFRELQNYPVVPYELSVIADKKVYSEEICRIASKADPKLIMSSEVVSIYEGDPIPAGKKSVSIKIVFGTNERTLKPDEIEQLQNSVINALNKKGFSLR
ncbi:MAG: phenylalanine--tRNA ligase subunit beta [Spirochaetes bacterium]|nr:phenylalanine--tRNA ligase subunit beta [Spirochaetota bacterium]